MPKSSTTDATKLLAEGHRKVEELFEKFEKTKGAEKKQKIVHEICTELNVHTRIEEEIFYPALRGKIEEDDLDEAYVEHDSAKALILELEQAQPDEEYRSEEHTSELQSLMRISYAVFCLKKKTHKNK